VRTRDPRLDLFEEIFSHTRDRVYGFMKSILKDEMKVEDCMQQCYLKLWENIERINTDADVLPLLYTYARNIAIDHIRRNARYLWVEDISLYSTDAENTVEKQLNNKEISQQVNQILDVLPPKQREVFKLIRLQGLSYREAAARLQISVNTVENHIREANKSLTKEMLLHISVVCIIGQGIHVSQL
jgi:RNA polymerase sigma-70 factor (family 1)